MSRTRACLKNAFCFNMFSAYYNNNSGQSFKKQLHRKPKPSGDSPNHSKVTNIGGRLSSGASFCLRQIPIYISSFFLCSLRFASSLSSTYNTAVTGIANIIPIAPKRLPPINAALNVQSGASPTEPPTTLG